MPRLAALTTFLLLAGGSTPALADLVIDDPPPKSEDEDGCSASNERDAILGLAALALLVSGMRLRQRSPEAAPSGIV